MVALNGQDVKKKKQWRDRSFQTTLDPHNPHLLRSLEERELACIYIYLYHKNKYGSLPSSEMKYPAIRKAAKELGIELDLSRDVVDHYLFTDLFPHNRDIPFTSAVRRLIGDSRTDTTPHECRAALIWLSDELTKQAKQAGLEVERVLPNTGDIKRMVELGVVVPELACPMPTWETIRRNLGPGNWRDVIAKVFDATEAELRFRFPKLATLEELVEDYTKAYEYFYGAFDETNPQILSMGDLEIFGEVGGIGYNKYKSYFVHNNVKSNGSAQRFNLDTVRSAAGLPIDEIRSNWAKRSKRSKWTKEEVFAGYMAAWKHYGLENPPPDNKQIVDLVCKQTEAMGYKKALDPIVAHEQGIPTTIIPCIGTIGRTFGGMTELLGYVEKIHGELKLDSTVRVNRMASEAIKRKIDPELLPKAVREAIAILNSRRNSRQLSIR